MASDLHLPQKDLPLIKAIDVSKSFQRNDRQDLLVLDKVNFSLNAGELVAILGKSGSGKSTLLRILMGLSKPNAGEVYFKGKAVHKPMRGLTMVFQNFALLPWLTVLQNVELGLLAQGNDKSEARDRALKAIDIVGMDGFESAYPRELSGGMCQRIGLARVLVMNPDVILMDEPFSALDVLTSENLRSDLLDLWQSGKTNLKSILMVTHNIEEAVFLADRILIFGNNPGHVCAEIPVKLSYPRNAQSGEFRKLVDEIYRLITNPDESKEAEHFGPFYRTIKLHHRLPKAPISELSGLLEAIHSPEYLDKVELHKVAEALHLDVDDLFPLTEALEILKFANVSEGEITLTTIGKQFAEADILHRKKIFADQLLRYVPLARHVRQILDERPGHKASETRFLEELEDGLSEGVAEEVLKIVIDWGRYAEIFAYDANSGKLSLENP